MNKDINLKGKAELFFYDKNGNLINYVKNNNTVTNAVRKLLSPDFACDVFENSNIANLGESLTPIWRLFGGLLVFNKNNNVSEYIPQKSHFDNFTGNVGGSYQGASYYRGNFLANESIISDDMCDLWFEYDLEQMTGNIKSFSLTSVAGGATGLTKDIESDTSFFTAYGIENPGEVKTIAGIGNADGGGISSCCFVPYVLKDIDGVLVGNIGKSYICVKVDGTNVTIKKFTYQNNLTFKNTVRKVKDINDYISNFGGSLEGLGLIKKELETTISSNLSLSDEYHFTFRNNKLYSCVFENGNFNVVEIDISNSDDIKIKYGIAETNLDNILDCRCDGNKIYATNNNWLYCIQMPDLQDVQSPTSCMYDSVELLESGVAIPYQDTVCIFNNSETNGEEEQRNIYFLNNNNILCKNTIIIKNSCENPIFGFVDLDGPIIGILSKTTTNGQETTSINANVVPYLATVNNLSTELWKYATSTLKIHYNLTMT